MEDLVEQDLYSREWTTSVAKAKGILASYKEFSIGLSGELGRI